MKRRLRVGRNTYVELVKDIGKHALPTQSTIKKYEDSVKIKLTPFLGGHKADLREAITKTIQRILELKKYSCKDISKLIVKISAGYDGSGSHVQCAGRDSNINTKVYLFRICYFKKYGYTDMICNVIKNSPSF